MSSPTLTMRGYNPDTQITMKIKRSTPEGFGYALSEGVQFNVNMQVPPSGAIFVDASNNGVVEIAVTSEHTIDDAWALFPLSAEPIFAPHLEIATFISTDKKSVTFNVRTADSGALIFTTAFLVQFAPA